MKIRKYPMSGKTMMRRKKSRLSIEFVERIIFIWKLICGKILRNYWLHWRNLKYTVLYLSLQQMT